MTTHVNKIINKKDKHIDEQKNLGKCVYIQNVEYNKQITQICGELNKKRWIKYSTTKMITNIIDIKQDESKKS